MAYLFQCRLSEALARLHLDEEVRVEYVKEAHRLLQKSIIFVESEDIELEDNEEGTRFHTRTLAAYSPTPSKKWKESWHLS